MSIELIRLLPGDGDIPALARMYGTPSVKKYISIADNYFDYVTGTAGVVYHKICADGVLTGGLHCETDGRTMYLDICIMDEYRRRGIAEAALRMLLQTLPDDADTVEVSIDETNVPSLNLFRKLGFIPSGREDELIMYRFYIPKVASLRSR